MSFFNGYSTYGGQSQSSPTRTGVWGGSHSPFRSTNLTLQDITIDNTLPCINGMNARSPGKTTANGPGLGLVRGVTGIVQGTGGRTMKEYEDQLGMLKKENFNLKLRIYFLEERMGITSADEDAVKKNIELKVEVESLRKELIEKQDLLSQAAKAFELIEEQKEASTRNQTQYQQSLDVERERIADLERELEEYKEKLGDPSMYYKEAFGVTPEESLENKEKLNQMEKLVAALEVEVKQITSSLEEERTWALELEGERDQLKERLESEVQLREGLVDERNRDIDQLREKVRQLEEQVFKWETISQQHKSELLEKDRIVKEKTLLLDERLRAYEELHNDCEKRKKQVDSLRASVKARDDALIEINNKHKTLLSQFECNSLKIKSCSPPSSPTTPIFFDDSRSRTMGQRSGCMRSPRKNNNPVDWEPNRERSSGLNSKLAATSSRDIKELAKELEEKDIECKRQEEGKKQLTLKLCNAQKSAEVAEQRVEKLTAENEKAMKMIQGFLSKQEKLEDKLLEKDRKIMELEVELSRPRSQDSNKSNRRGPPVRRDLSNEMTDNPERDQSNQQRFEEMESKINDLRVQIEIIKAEKNKLEMQIQAESEEVQEKLKNREQRIEYLESERSTIRTELSEKSIELQRLKEAYNQASIKIEESRPSESKDENNLREELLSKNAAINERDLKIEQLTKELQIRTQNLQKLVNTELWSKNKEIAKLHNHMTATHGHEKSRNKSESSLENSESQVTALIKELLDIGIQVKISNEVVQLNYIGDNETIDVKTLKNNIQKLFDQRNELEKEIDYLKWLKLISKPDIGTEIESSGSETEKARKYCELLRTHLKELVRFMKNMLIKANHADAISKEHKKIVLDVFLDSKILPDDFIHALEEIPGENGIGDPPCLRRLGESRPNDGVVKKSYSEHLLDGNKNQNSTQSDSEAFSEPDRTVSLARIGLQELQHKSTLKQRFSKYTKTFSDSEDSMDYVPYHKTYQSDLNDLDATNHIQELKETNNLLYSELNSLRNELSRKTLFDDRFDEKLAPLIAKLERSQRFCERLQTSLDKKMHECHALKKESKQNSVRKAQLEKKITEVESMAIELTKQKVELLQAKENAERQAADMLTALNRENDTLRSKIKKMEEEMDAARKNLAVITKEMDQLTLSHSQVLVENTKLTNEKLKLEQDVRKIDSRYDIELRSLNDKFTKEIRDLNQMNDSHRLRMQELEIVNKELRRHVAVCEASDSAPSSSGVSSIPTDTTIKQGCDDILQEYHCYNGSQYWLPINYPTATGRCKSSCSPDLGIESDAALTTTRPLKDTLKITESMTNLLSEDENCNTSRELRDMDSESPLPTEGLNEMEVLKQENEALKRRLMKTRRALEDTFQHLSASNKNKKNVEKAITKQLMITKTILKKTRTYEEP
ncbi:CDK5 regulatory subunit-associated protein 2 isoform X2 [Athalia rosae]|uniref:CDK5 regulatory subunit-associated protein 2 isoform X2 n=1 Tax=Athalia rosae TaxID=37344 RepID=UPI00203335D0|nr:CDK5 regulatory subunit-associated protein 2 isoform X2 [Athalia rosae]